MNNLEIWKYAMFLKTKSYLFNNFNGTNYGKFLLMFKGAQIWNKLPNDLKMVKSYNSFNKCTKCMCKSKILDFTLFFGQPKPDAKIDLWIVTICNTLYV